jgi:putative selenate reductase
VQTLDELSVAAPLHRHAGRAGYNVEWSQELKMDQSIEEYQRAWVLLHALHHHLGFPGEGPGVIFNLSVGYNLRSRA